MLALPECPVYCAVPAVESKTRRPLLRLLGLASITVTFLAASSAPTPLYATYQRAWGFSALTTTVVFGVYALAFLSALLTVGRLSDHIGRRPVLLAGIAGQILALVVFADAHSVTALLAARIVQGLATGTAIGAVGAGMLDIDQARGAVANATAPGLGTASGALLSSFAVQWLPAPTHLVYLVLAAVLLLQAFGVFLLPEAARGHLERGVRWSRRSPSPLRPADQCWPPPLCSSPCGPSPGSTARSDRA
jgi:MFS family permease